MTKFFILAGGSVAGGVARYYMGGLVYRVLGSSFPYGTFAVNMTGCLLIGFLSTLAEKKFLIGPEGRLFLMIGFCGAFTTFSTFMLETASLIRDGETLPAFLNVLLSVIVGFVVLRLGILAGEFI